MEYEVKHNDRTVGTLKVEREGLMTVFEARTRRLEGVQRLWVCGEDKCAYLGVLIPAGTELCLRRKLSRRDMAAFPEKILYAATAEPKYAARPRRGAEEEKPSPAPQGAKPGKETAPKAAPEPEKRPEKKPAVPQKEQGRVWERASMGTLVASCGGIVYTAIPATLRRAAPGVRLETINGREYIVFRRSY